MREIPLTIPELALIAGTRALGGAGIGLLLADRLSSEQRREVGWTLLAVAALTTVPIVALVFSKRQAASELSSRRFSRMAEPSSS